MNARPRVSKAHDLFLSVKELRTYTAFQLRNLFGESGLTDVQSACCPREVQLSARMIADSINFSWSRSIHTPVSLSMGEPSKEDPGDPRLVLARNIEKPETPSVWMRAVWQRQAENQPRHLLI